MTTSALGRRAVACHVALYTAVQLAATIGITRAFCYRVTPAALLAGAAINAGTHAAIDRGALLLWLAKKTKQTGYVEHCQAVRMDDDGRLTREVNGPGTAWMELDVLCTKGASRLRSFLCGERGRGALDLQDNCRACHGLVLMHGDHLAGLKVLPLRRVQGRESYRSLSPGLQGGHELHPEPGNVESRLAGRGPVADVPHRSQDAGAGDGRLSSRFGGRAEDEVGSENPVAGLEAAPVAPGRTLLQSHLFGGDGQGFPEAERKRVDVTEFFQQVEGHFPLVVNEVLPDIAHRDVVLSGDLLRNQQGSGFQQLGDVHALILDHGVLAAAGGTR
ncbi:hypothetical protein [Streptomyces cyaneofuscatus]|uniref:hypothetical protein n=1 Tax=Streptomyces cyaneofuscatus TaxID=66883 RepID=UPI0037A708F0